MGGFLTPEVGVFVGSVSLLFSPSNAGRGRPPALLPRINSDAQSPLPECSSHSGGWGQVIKITSATARPS